MADTTREPSYPEQTLWVGWIVFGASMMILLGVFHAFQGLVALLSSDYYLVGRNGLSIHVSYTTWGWVHLILGIVVIGAGAGLLSGRMGGRIVGVAVALVSAVVNAGFLSAYPFWSAIMITLDILVIWAITVHGREMRRVDAASTF